jgi:hypothetical protein
MKPGGPIQRRAELARGAGPARKTGLARVSKKRATENRLRRRVVDELFPERPACVVPDCPRPADDIHEPLTRGRGGSITDAENMLPLCRPCDTDITDNQPAWAYALGLLHHAWDDKPAA